MKGKEGVLTIELGLCGDVRQLDSQMEADRIREAVLREMHSVEGKFRPPLNYSMRESGTDTTFPFER